jgi:hypothetical protein
VSHGDWRKGLEERGVPTLIPLDRELVWRIKRELIARKLGRLQRREPGLNYVIRKLCTRSVEES